MRSGVSPLSEPREPRLRHFFYTPTNDALHTLCGSKIGVVRMDLSNVNCERCRVIVRLRMDPTCDTCKRFIRDPQSGLFTWNEQVMAHVAFEHGRGHVTEKRYLICNNCGEAFDDIDVAAEHGPSNPQSMTWCGDDGFVISLVRAWSEPS